MYDTASELCKELLEVYFDEHDILSDAKRKNMNTKYNPTDLILDTNDYSI